MIEGWMIEVAIAAACYGAIFVTVKNKGEQTQKEVDEVKARSMKLDDKFEDKIDSIMIDLAKYKARLDAAPSMEAVNAGFVSKEMFKQMEKHIDERFDGLGKSLASIEGNQTRIFEKLEDLGRL